MMQQFGMSEQTALTQQLAHTVPVLCLQLKENQTVLTFSSKPES